MTNAERLSFLAAEIDKLLSVRKQSQILLKKNDYEFVEKRATVWINKNPNGEVPAMEGFSFTLDEKRRVNGIKFRGIRVVNFERQAS